MGALRESKDEHVRERDDQTQEPRDGERPNGNDADAEAGAEEETFEAAFARLEEIVRILETGDIPLHESLALFEEGVRVARLCSQRLDAAETKIKVLLEDEEGNLSERAWMVGEGTGKLREGWDAVD